MKKSLLLFLSVGLLSSFSLIAQERNTATADISVAFGKGLSSSISAEKLFGIGNSGRLKIGFGGRLTNYSNKTTDFITAPAKLTSNEANLDTLQLSIASVTSLNIPIYIQYAINEKIDLGFNIDAFGLSFGNKQTGTFYASNAATLNKTQQTASPTTFSLLLVGDNDLGSLNSQFYARYWITEKMGVRLGASLQFVEYTTQNVLTLDNDRFRAKIMQPFVAISYRF
jgi:hypothetical protein